MKASKLIPLLVIGVGLLVYHNSLTGPFIFDDVQLVPPENPTVRYLWPVWQVLSPPSSTGVGGRPVLNFSLAINYALGRTSVRGYHALNLAIHILAGLTLFGVVRRTLLRPALRERFGTVANELALATAVVWIVHPLQTEAVTYVSQRAESLMGLFYLLTLYCFIRGAESQRSGLWYTLSVVACLSGMATKEVMVTAPLMVLLYDRTFVAGSFREAWTRRWRLYVGLGSTWLLVGYHTASFHDRGVGYGLGITWEAYALTECRVVVNYLWLALCPHPLIFDYGEFINIPPAAEVVSSVLILALLGAAVVVGLKRGSAIGFIGAWFFVILAPTSSVVPVAYQPMAESRMYLPLAAVVAMVVGGGFVLGRNLLTTQQQTRRILEWGVSGVLVLVLGILTIQRNRDYRSAVSIWQDTVVKCPANPRAHYHLAVALWDAGKRQEAIDHYEQVVRINPDLFKAQNNLGFALSEVGKPQEAIDHYEQALRIKPDLLKAHSNLGFALLQVGKPQEAIGHFERALQLKPDSAEAHNNLGFALLQVGKVQEAISRYEQALRIKPDAASIQNNLAWVLATHAPAEGGEPVRAMTLAERACELTGSQAPAYLDTLGAAYAAAGRFDEAIASAQKAIELARSAGHPQLVEEIQTHLELYCSGNACRQAIPVTIPPQP